MMWTRSVISLVTLAISLLLLKNIGQLTVWTGLGAIIGSGLFTLLCVLWPMARATKSGEDLRRWWHFRFWGWVADHGPEGLVFNCVLRAYCKLMFAKTHGDDFSGATLTNEAGRWAEDAVTHPKPIKLHWPDWTLPLVVGSALGLIFGFILGFFG